MKNNSSLGDSLKSVFAAVVIPVEIVIAILIYMFVLGNPANFVDNNPENHPLEGNWLGIIYKGGVIVPVLISMLLMTVTFSIERLLTISRASGKGSIKNFVTKIRSLVAANRVSDAIAEYNAVANDSTLDPEKKVLLIQKDIEETTQLEMPMLEKNLVIIATLASVATLVGLLGTVMGMIKAFASMATAGAPDAVGLANGISEALINTALGIGTSAIAIIMYNYFTSKIDALTYGIDEAGYSIVQNFASKNKIVA
jgi:biopolymer transport protein ExbB